MTLFNSGTCSYNGVAFTSMYKSKASMTPVKDSAGRALVARKYDIEIEGRIGAAPGSTTDFTLAQMRSFLAQPAGHLQYVDKGFGSLDVNKPGGQLRDCEYGPWSEVLDFTPIGNDQAALVRWKIMTVVPCEEYPAPEGVIEWCWDEAWDIDNGLTTHTITGHVIVQATRTAPMNRTIPANADDYREKIVPALPDGFRRKQSYKLSEDKRRLDYTITDEELPFPLPLGISAAEVRQKIGWRMKEAALLRGSISGTLTVPNRQAKSQIYERINLLVNNRISNMRAQKAANSQSNVIVLAQLRDAGFNGIQFAQAMIDGFELDDEMFGLSTTFNVSFVIYGVNLSAILAASGIWDAVPGTDFRRWRASVLDTAFNPRGTAGMQFLNSSDAILDLCTHEDPRGIEAQINGGPEFRTLKGQRPKQDIVPPEKSWIFYWCRIRLIEDDRIARHKPLSQRKPPAPVPPLDGFITSVSPGFIPPNPNDFGGPKSPAASDKGTPGPGVTTTTPDLLQRVGSPTYRVLLEGVGVRAGYSVPIPRLDSVGGVAVMQAGQDVSQELITRLGPIPIYKSKWRIVYELPDDPKGDLPVPVNPALPAN